MQPEHETEDDEFDYPVHTVVSAAATVRPVALGPSSIFDVAAILSSARVMLKQGRFGDDAGFEVQAVRLEGVTRVQGQAYPSNRWTPEKEEKEIARRARQKPPRPTRKAVTTNGKIRVFDDE
jgi:hypothetical protein